MLWNSELSKFSFVSREAAEVGRKCILKVSDLTQLFCIDNLDRKPIIDAHPILQPVHVKAVAEFVNKEIAEFQNTIIPYIQEEKPDEG